MGYRVQFAASTELLCLQKAAWIRLSAFERVRARSNAVTFLSSLHSNREHAFECGYLSPVFTFSSVDTCRCLSFGIAAFYAWAFGSTEELLYSFQKRRSVDFSAFMINPYSRVLFRSHLSISLAS